MICDYLICRGNTYHFPDLHFSEFVEANTPQTKDQKASVMVSLDEQRAAQIEILRGLLDRLCSPDLTLGEAKVLRNQLLDFLERINPLLSEASKSDRHGNDPSAGNPKKTR
jgi:hypothetical protein